MKNRSTIFPIITILAFFIGVILVSCGGGGSSSGLEYTGLTSEATVTNMNAGEFLTDAYTGGDLGSSLNLVGAVQNQDTGHGGGSIIVNLPRTLKEAMSRIDVSSFPSSLAAGTFFEETLTLNGNCTGSATYTISIDDQSGIFNGSFTFTSFSDVCGGETINGRVSFSGSVNIIRDAFGEIISIEFDNMTMTFTGLTISGSESATVSGSITMDLSVSPQTVTVNMLLLDGSSGTVFRIDNYSLTVTVVAGYTDVTVSGTFYSPDEGFVVVSTPNPLRIFDGDNWPSSGTLVIVGVNSKARLICIDATSFSVEVDDNDDINDWTTPVQTFTGLLWDDF